MPQITNIEGNVSFELNLINNDFLDIDKLRPDFENWIPFEFNLCVEEDIFSYSSEDGATFTLYELKDGIEKFGNIINKKLNHISFDKEAFNCLECYFDFMVSDSLEENLISVDLWINTGALTNGKSFGYNFGFQFDVNINQFNTFIESIKNQLIQLLNENLHPNT